MSEEMVTVKSNKVKNNKSWVVDDDRIRKLGEHIHKNFRARVLYHWVNVLLFLEALVYAIFTILREWRTSAVKKIHEGQKNR